VAEKAEAARGREADLKERLDAALKEREVRGPPPPPGAMFVLSLTFLLYFKSAAVS
jgi:hypothetical protein